jgi:sec-independent protein translocase protein TatA
MMHMPSFPMMIIIAVIGILLFGKRLPEVGRSLGKGIVEFKKGLKGVEEEVDQQANQPAQQQPKPLPEHKFDPYTGQPVSQPAAKFDPYTGKPVEQTESAPSDHATV